MKDETILELYIQRDETALARTEQKYRRLLFSVALNITGSRRDAEECVNSALLRAWQTIPPAPNSLPAYLTKLVRNASVDLRREANAKKRGGGELPLVYEELGEILPDGSEDLGEQAALRELLNDFLRALPEDDRRLFLRRYYYSCTVAELARMHGMSRGAVKMKLSRIREKLKKYLDAEGVSL